MDEPRRPVPGRRRWTWVLAAIGLLLAGGAFTLSRLLEPERLTAFLLERAAAATGLALALEQPADVGLWPDLHIELMGLSASAPGQAAPLFTVRQLDLVLPWSALLEREPVVQRLRLAGPVLQWQALRTWLDARPLPPEPRTAFRLPELTAGVDIEDGAVLSGAADGWSLRDLALSTSPLLDGHAFQAALSGTLQVGDGQHDLALQLRTRPRQAGAELVLQPLALSLSAGALPQPLELEGELALSPDRLALQLAGRLAEWPPGWPAPPVSGAAPLTLALHYQGPVDGSAAAAIQVQGQGATLRANAAVPALLDWWRAPAPRPLPPAVAELSAERLELGGATLQQLEVRLDEAEPAGPGAPRP